MDRIETGLWGWAILGLALCYVTALTLLGDVGGHEWLLALAAARR